QRQIQLVGPGAAAEAVDRDAVRRAGYRGEGQCAGLEPGAVVVVVLNQGEGVDGAAGVDTQERVERAAPGVERHRPVRGRGPGEPDRVPAGVVGDQELA